MGNLMSCVLICGAVEVVQVVHSDGHVEKLIRPLEVQHSKKQQRKRANSSMQEDTSISSNCLFEDNSKMPLEAEPLSGHSYLLLPIHNVGLEGSGIYKYKRLSSFQFYKSAFSSSSRSNSSSSSRSSSRSSRSGDCGSRNNDDTSALAVAAKGSRKGHNNKKPHEKNVDDRKQLLNSQVPFRVKQEGGVTKLVVSKKYLAQLLSESNMKKSSSSSSSSSNKEGISSTTNTSRGDRKGSSRTPPNPSGAQPLPASPPVPCTKPSHSAAPRVGRPSVWRPALESISEAHIR